MTDTWTDERVQFLHSMWLGRMTTSQIAKALGEGVTRNSVIGKIHRLGWNQTEKQNRIPVDPGSRAARLEASTNRTPRATPPSRTAPLPRQVETRSVPRLVSPTPRPQSLVAPQMPETEFIGDHAVLGLVDEYTCKYPIGDPQSDTFRFCGVKNPGCDGPYCEFHSHLAYKPGTAVRKVKSIGSGYVAPRLGASDYEPRTSRTFRAVG